jgi:hypothetical protein
VDSHSAILPGTLTPAAPAGAQPKPASRFQLRGEQEAGKIVATFAKRWQQRDTDLKFFSGNNVTISSVDKKQNHYQKWFF